MTVIAIGAAGIAAVLMAVQLKGMKGEYATYQMCIRDSHHPACGILRWCHISPAAHLRGAVRFAILEWKVSEGRAAGAFGGGPAPWTDKGGESSDG